MSQYSYITGEERPVEVLVFRMDPAVVEEFIRVDHEVWTLGEAHMEGPIDIPFLSKEVWLDTSKPGEVTIVFVWDTQDAWNIVGNTELQKKLQSEFDSRFPYPIELIAAPHEDSHFGIHRVTRFERIEK
ncbi:MAG: TIGR03792 family protein [Ilumatobacteraceae bacterium]|nr:TIGR03792 family protein [Ilumatobacteraceae bacterium]